MEKLGIAKHFGTDSKRYQVNGLTLVHSSFHHFASCPWHYHQNAHFAFTTGGTLTETHRKFQLRLQAGSLLYNYSDEPHCNAEYSEHVSALHVDVEPSWFATREIDFAAFNGVRVLRDPLLKSHFYRIFNELQVDDTASHLSIEAHLLECISHMLRTQGRTAGKTPAWVDKVRNLLYDRYTERILLKEVAVEAGLHPVYLCQQFPMFFHCSFGEYIRKIRIEKAVDRMLQNSKRTLLTEIAFECGFSDQSHFIRTFKQHIGVTPLVFQKGLRP